MIRWYCVQISELSDLLGCLGRRCRLPLLRHLLLESRETLLKISNFLLVFLFELLDLLLQIVTLLSTGGRRTNEDQYSQPCENCRHSQRLRADVTRLHATPVKTHS